MQFARDILFMKDADSEEFRPESKEPVIIHMPEGISRDPFLALLKRPYSHAQHT